MLDIKTKQSDNSLYVSGILKELDINNKKTTDGREYANVTATIRVDQEVDGTMTENEILVRLFAFKKKKDGTDNKLYPIYLKYAEQFTSLSAAETPTQASRVTVYGDRVNLSENIYYNANTQKLYEKSFQISASFLNTARETDEEGAHFELSGVVGKTREETDGDGNETGRLIIDFIIIGYNGRADVIQLYASGNAKSFIEQNWNDGDTVRVTGDIVMSYKVETTLEEQGFGKPIERRKTTSRRELIITGGSQSGLEEELSYDANDIKVALNERNARKEEAMKTTKPAASKPKSGFDF